MEDFKGIESKVDPAKGLKPALRDKSQKRRKRYGDLSNIRSQPPDRRNDLLPSLTITNVPIGTLTAAQRRVRKQDAAQIARVRASIERFGVVYPIIVDENHHIVHGHAVYDAAREEGLPALPVVSLTHLSKDELRLLSITLNRLAETGTWDDENLKLELEELEAAGEDFSIAGFTAEETDILLLDEDPEDETAEIVPPVAANAVSEPGDLWQLGSHRLFNGDATKPESYSRLMAEGELARAVVTDTPYNVPNKGHVTSQSQHEDFKMAGGEMTRDEFFVFLKAWLLASSAYVMDGGLVASFIDWRSVDLVLNAGHELGLLLLNIIVWAKQNGGQGSFWRSQHELFPVFKKGGAPHVNNIELGRHGRWRSNVWSYPGASTLGSDSRQGLADHPTVKPRAMMEDALLDISNRGDIIVDPFLGSGSTLIAAETTARRCRGIELDGRYCDLTIWRWQELAGEDAVLAETGETFGEVQRRRGAPPLGDNPGQPRTESAEDRTQDTDGGNSNE